MFDECKIIHRIKSAIVDLINNAINDKKAHDKLFMLTVIEYEEEEYESLVDVLDYFDRIYSAALHHAASDECETWFEKLYCTYDNTNLQSIKDFCMQYTKTVHAEYDKDDVDYLFDSIRYFPKTIDLIEVAKPYYETEFSQSKIEAIDIALDYMKYDIDLKK